MVPTLITSFLVQAILISIIIREHKNNVRWKKATVEYFERLCRDRSNACAKHADAQIAELSSDFSAKIRKINNGICAMGRENKRMATEAETRINEKISLLNKRVDDLSVDYTEAQQASKKINDFAAGMANIFFDDDPVKIMRRNREEV